MREYLTNYKKVDPCAPKRKYKVGLREEGSRKITVIDFEYHGELTETSTAIKQGMPSKEVVYIIPV